MTANDINAGAADRLDDHIAKGLLIRDHWTGYDESGRETACMLSAMYPEVARAKAWDACPAGTIPEWWARCTLSINDDGSAGAWPALVRRYAAVAHRWHALSGDDWLQLHLACREIAAREARRHGSPDEIARIDAVLAYWDRVRGAQDSLAVPVMRADGTWLNAADASRRATSMAWDAVVESYATFSEAAEAAAAKASAEALDRIASGWLGALEAACAAREAS